MSSVILLKSGSFRAFARHKGLKEDQTFTRQDKARAWADATEQRMKKGTWTPPEKGDEKKHVRTFKDAAEEYLKSPKFLDKKETTRHSEKHKLNPAIAALGNIALTQITIVDIEEYLEARALVQPKRVQLKIKRMHEKARAEGKVADIPKVLLEQRLSKDQRRLELAAISAVLNYGKFKKWVSDNPAWHVERPGWTERTGRIGTEEMGRLMEFFILLDTGEEDADKRPYWFFSLLFSCLARPGELAKVRREWLRHDPPQIVLPGTSAKNKDARTIVVPVNLYNGLMRYMETVPADCPYIFPTRSRDRKSWKPYNYAVPWKKATTALGYESLVPHLSRHEGISRLFERTNLSDGQIASLSGHRTSQALYRYKHLRNETQRKKIEDLHQDVMDAANRALAHAHPSRGLKPGERLGENRTDKKTASGG